MLLSFLSLLSHFLYLKSSHKQTYVKKCYDQCNIDYFTDKSSIRWIDLFPDVFGSSTSDYDLYSDLSDILKESHGEICEFETIKDHTFYDCTNRNIS